MTTVGGAFLRCVEHRLESLCHQEGVKKDRLESLCHQEGVKKDRLESLCHQEGVKKHRLESLCHQEGVKKDRLERLRLCRKPVVGLEIDSGAWALARFCTPWVPNAGEKEKSALPRERKAFPCGVSGRGGGVGWQPRHSFPSRLATDCGAKSVPKPTRLAPPFFQACSWMCHGWTPGWGFGGSKCHCVTRELASARSALGWGAPVPTGPIPGYRELYNPGLRSGRARGKWAGDFVVRSITGDGMAEWFNRGGSWPLPRGQGGRRWAPL